MTDFKHDSQCNEWTLPFLDSDGEVREFSASVRTSSELIEKFEQAYPYELHGFVIAGKPYFDDLPF